MLSGRTLDLQLVQANRVGQSRPTGRPILVRFRNALSVKSLIKCKSKLRSLDKWTNFWINSDLTRSQQTEMNSLRETLRQKRQNGDYNSIIKYVKGMPTTCSKN